MSKKVVVGMSGGVDSSVAAYILKEEGYDVIGVTMQIWQDEDEELVHDKGGCCGLSAVDDARRIANQLDIPYYVMNFKDEFQYKVIDYFIDEYEKGRTPNPCIACNRYVKWESLLQRSMEIGADLIATGHYAKIERLSNGRYALKKSVTDRKDQTYALYNLTQFQLAHTLMPIGDYSKEEIRKIAEKIDIVIANKPDSQEICFIPDNNYENFLEKNKKKESLPGNFVDVHGKVLGQHKGLIYYTIGQRKGLGIAFGKPMYVLEIKPETNEVVLGDNEEAYEHVLYANELNFMYIEKLEKPMKVMTKIRYSHQPAQATIEIVEADKVRVTFKEPQRAITPGQAVVFYFDEYVVGGGTIIRS